MDPLEKLRATAQELVVHAQQQGIDLRQFRKDFTFLNDRRWIDVWRKAFLAWDWPCPWNLLGTLHYNMQGTISGLRSRLKGSAGAFRGAWSEAGTFEDMEQAFELVKAWLLDWKEVDDLPSRSVRRYGI